MLEGKPTLREPSPEVTAVSGGSTRGGRHEPTTHGSPAPLSEAPPGAAHAGQGYETPSMRAEAPWEAAASCRDYRRGNNRWAARREGKPRPAPLRGQHERQLPLAGAFHKGADTNRGSRGTDAASRGVNKDSHRWQGYESWQPSGGKAARSGNVRRCLQSGCVPKVHPACETGGSRSDACPRLMPAISSHWRSAKLLARCGCSGEKRQSHGALP